MIRNDEQENARSPLEPRDLQLEQRRTIISVRLTDHELARLRSRADETGISVSAYMRSCVLDAEHLRAQVKQALAEMRALTVEPEPSSFSALSTVRGTAEKNGATWFRVLFRYAAFLVSPLFPFRRSA